MSKKIYYRDQCKLNQILEQVEALSDVVDELRTELNHLKKISFNINHENICFEIIKENNKIDYTNPNVLQKVKAYFEGIGVSIRNDKTCGLAKNNQVLKKEKRNESKEPSRFSAIHGSLKYFKNKIIKNIQSVRKTQQSPKSIKNKYVTSSRHQPEPCLLLRRKEEEKSLKFDGRNEDINKYIDIGEELCNSADTSFTSNASTQADISICSRQDDKKKSRHCNCLTSQNVTENNKQTSPLSMISNDRSVIYSDKFADELSKNHMRQMFLKSKIKKYKRCSCKEQCPYALYKLPCNKYRCSTPEKKINDEISGLTLECLSFREKKDFPKFINVDTVRNSECFTDSSPIEIGMDKSSTASLSMDLEINICNDYCDLEDIEFTKQRKARTYIINRARKNNLIKDFRAENEPSLNIISSWRNISEKEGKVNEIVKKVLSQRRYIYSEENNEGYQKSGAGEWPIKNNNKQIPCVIPALTTPVFSRKMSVKTSTSNFQQRHIQLSDCYACQTTGKASCNSFPKIIIPRRMKTNIIQTQVNKRLRLNYLANGSLALDAYTDKNTKKTNDEDEGRKITRKRNICDICATEIDASSSQIIWPRMKSYNIYSALQTKEDINIYSNKPLNQTCDLAVWQNRIMPMKPSCCNHVFGKKLENCTGLSNPIDYHPPSKALTDFDMSNVSDKLYDCFEKLEHITA